MSTVGNLGPVNPVDPVALRAHVERHLDAYLADLAALVAIDSGTRDAEGIRRVAALVAGHLEGLGAVVELRESAAAGPTVIARLASGRPGARVLVVAHMDTVFPPGTAAARPFAIADGRATGPGVADMKGGILLLVHALDALRATTGTAVQAGELVVIAGPDEEVGSPAGSVAIREAAAAAAAALVLEPARPSGALIASRRGMLAVRLTFTGLAAHAGVAPEQGRSAILAAAHATIALHAIPASIPGVTCSVGTIAGGTRANVIPDLAILDIDLRADTALAMAAVEATLDAVCASPAVDGVTIAREDLGRFAPMESTPGGRDLLALAVEVGGKLGLAVTAEATGGASDANAIAALGVPVLDGLGPVGGGFHAPGEHLVVASVPERAALLGGLLAALAGRGPGRP